MVAGTTFAGDMLLSYQYGMSLGVTGYFIPVAAILPICYVERQMHTGNIWHLCVIRSSRRAYVLSALFAAILSGVVVSLGTFALFRHQLSPHPAPALRPRNGRASAHTAHLYLLGSPSRASLF